MLKQKNCLILSISVFLIVMPALSEAGLIKVSVKNSYLPGKVIDVELAGSRFINYTTPSDSSFNVEYNRSSSQYTVDVPLFDADARYSYQQFRYKVYEDRQARNPIAWGAFQCTLESGYGKTMAGYWHCPSFEEKNSHVKLNWVSGTQDGDKAVLEAEITQ